MSARTVFCSMYTLYTKKSYSARTVMSVVHIMYVIHRSSPYCRDDSIQGDQEQSPLQRHYTGNTRRLPVSFEDVRGIVLFIQAYADINAILLPGRITG